MTSVDKFVLHGYGGRSVKRAYGCTVYWRNDTDRGRAKCFTKHLPLLLCPSPNNVLKDSTRIELGPSREQVDDPNVMNHDKTQRLACKILYGESHNRTQTFCKNHF